MSTLSFQPEADRYYADGYWRPGDLWGDFAARAHAQPDKVALLLDDRRITYDELRAPPSRCPRGSPPVRCSRATWSCCSAATRSRRRSRCSAACTAASCSRRCRRCSTSRSSRPSPVRRGRRRSSASGRERDRQVRAGGAARRAADLPAARDPGRADRRGRGRRAQRAPGRRHRAGDAFLRHHVGAQGHRALEQHAALRHRGHLPALGARGDDRCLVATEFGFVGGLVFGYFPVLLNGGTGVLMSRWKPEEALRLIEEHRCTYVLLMPTHAADTLLAAQATTRDLSSMRVLAAPGLTPERRLAMRTRSGSRRWRLRPLRGARARRARPERAGGEDAHDGRPPYDGTEIRILGRDGRRCRRQVGDVVVNGPSRFLFFLGNDELTRDSLTGWGGYRTGDLGYLDEDGHLVYVGRSKDIIRRGGVTVVPAELEPVLMRHPAVHEAAVVPLPDERLGERACAALILKAGAGADARRAAGVPRARGRRQVHVAGVGRGLRRVPAHPVAEGGQARGRQADRRARRRAGRGLIR